jgi:hypothetical protein
MSLQKDPLLNTCHFVTKFLQIDSVSIGLNVFTFGFPKTRNTGNIASLQSKGENTYIPLTLDPRRGSRGVLDVSPISLCFIKMT